MQISVETISDIGRKMIVQLPEEKIRKEVDSRLKSLAHRVKIDGFRAGKAPARIIRQRFGKQIREEVIHDLIGSTFSEAVKEQALNLAGEPKITSVEKSEGEGLSYEARFEIYPEIHLESLEELQISKPVCEITDADLDMVIERLREQKKTWHEVDRPARPGDRITLRSAAFVNGTPLNEGNTDHLEVELGSGNMIPGFEDQLLDSKAGDHLEFELPFPQDYHDAKLAGHRVSFRVDVERVEEGRLPGINAEFVKEYGVESGDVEEFRREVRANMDRRIESAIQEQVKARVLDALYKRDPIPVPESLLKQEIQRVLASVAEKLKKNPELLNQSSLNHLQENAKKRIAHGLLLAEAIRTNELQADPKRVRHAVEKLAANYEDPQGIINWYYDNPEQLARVESLVLEEQAVEWILERIRVTEEPVSFDELMKTQQSQGRLA